MCATEMGGFCVKVWMPHTVSSYKSLLKFIQSFVICSLLTETKPSVECCGGSVIGVNPLKQSTAGGYARTRSKMTRFSAFLILIWTNNNDDILMSAAMSVLPVTVGV